MTARADSKHRATTPSGMCFLVNPLDRRSAFRGDKAYINGLLEAPDTEVVLATALRLVFPRAASEGPPDRIGHALAQALDLGAKKSEMVFLGLRPNGGGALFATTINGEDEEFENRPGLLLKDLRPVALGADFGPEELGILAQARALIHWHRTHPFCSRCGEKTVLAEAGYRRDCPVCGASHFPRTDPCVIMLITDGDRALLGRPPRLPEGVYTTLAGFMEPGETIADSVRRETQEESGILVGKVQLIADQPWPFPANLMLGCIGEALSSEISFEDDELEACKWCDRAEVRQMIDGTHPEGHRIPPSFSIAYHLIAGWLERTVTL